MLAAPAIAHPASTLLLLRDAPGGLEVLMLRRHADTVFSGALVFPGGRVDAGDADDALIARCGAARGLDRTALAFRIAALRESHEEAHILLARPTGEATLVSAAALAALERETEARIGRPVHFADLAGGGAIELAVDGLVPFAHWVTPERAPRRYDTRFFLARAPDGQVPRPDGREAVAAQWITPALALAEADAQRERLVFATRMNLLRLAKSRDVAAALAAAAQCADRIVPLCPEIYATAAGFRIRIPPGSGLAMDYDDCDLPTADPAARR